MKYVLTTSHYHNHRTLFHYPLTWQSTQTNTLLTAVGQTISLNQDQHSSFRRQETRLECHAGGVGVTPSVTKGASHYQGCNDLN